MNLRTTSGLSDSNTTFGANPACPHSSSHTARNARVPASATNGAPAKSASATLPLSLTCSRGTAKQMRSRNACAPFAPTAAPASTVFTRTSQRAAAFAWLMTNAVCGHAARNAAMASTVISVAASMSTRTVLRSAPLACAIMSGTCSSPANSGAICSSSACPHGVKRMLRPCRSNSFASSSPSSRRMACVSAGCATPSRFAEFVICCVCATS